MAIINRRIAGLGNSIIKARTGAGLPIKLRKLAQRAETGRTDGEQPYPLEVSWFKQGVRE
jgi:hypothetical protein